jgi:hypothetical protein
LHPGSTTGSSFFFFFFFFFFFLLLFFFFLVLFFFFLCTVRNIYEELYDGECVVEDPTTRSLRGSQILLFLFVRQRDERDRREGDTKARNDAETPKKRIAC